MGKVAKLKNLRKVLIDYLFETIDDNKKIKEYLEKITTEMGLETKFEINEDEEVFSVKMFSNNNPILIGKDGRT